MTKSRAFASLVDVSIGEFDGAIELVNAGVEDSFRGLARRPKPKIDRITLRHYSMSFVAGIDASSVFAIIKSGHPAIDGTVYQIIAKRTRSDGSQIAGRPVLKAIFFQNVEDAMANGFTDAEITKHVQA